MLRHRGLRFEQRFRFKSDADYRVGSERAVLHGRGSSGIQRTVPSVGRTATKRPVSRLGESALSVTAGLPKKLPAAQTDRSSQWSSLRALQR